MNCAQHRITKCDFRNPRFDTEEFGRDIIFVVTARNEEGGDAISGDHGVHCGEHEYGVEIGDVGEDGDEIAAAEYIGHVVEGVEASGERVVGWLVVILLFDSVYGRLEGSGEGDDFSCGSYHRSQDRAREAT